MKTQNRERMRKYRSSLLALPLCQNHLTWVTTRICLWHITKNNKLCSQSITCVLRLLQHLLTHKCPFVLWLKWKEKAQSEPRLPKGTPLQLHSFCTSHVETVKQWMRVGSYKHNTKNKCKIIEWPKRETVTVTQDTYFMSVN